MPAGYDAEVAELFRDLRVASSLTETDLATRIAAPVEVVQALEQGAIYALPPWPETCRVVNAYGSLLNLDTRPLLRRIYAQLEAGIVELDPKSVPEVPMMAPQVPGHDFGLDAGGAPSPQPVPTTAHPALPDAAPWPNGMPAALPAQMPEPQAIHPPTPQQPVPQAPQPQEALTHEVLPQVPQPQVPQPQVPQPQQAQQAQHPIPQTQSQWSGGAPQFPQGIAAPPPAQAPASPQPQPWPNGPQAAPQPAAPFTDPAARYHPPQQGGAPNAAFPQDAHFGPEPGVDPQLQDPNFEGDTSFGEAAETETARKRPALLKWGIGALVAAVVLVGLWLAFGGPASDTGFSSGFNASDPVLDPDDPRSRKADRLPSKQ